MSWCSFNFNQRNELPNGKNLNKGRLAMGDRVSVKVWGEFALFTRPELKVERLSYPIMTPSAARGVLDAILFKPQMRWHVQRITALEPWWLPADPHRPHYRLVGVRRNEIQGKIAPRTVEAWMKDPS